MFVLWLQLSIIRNLRLKALVLWRWLSFSSMNIRMTSVVINKQWLFVSECKTVLASQLRNHCVSKTQRCSSETSTCDLFPPFFRPDFILPGLARHQISLTCFLWIWNTCEYNWGKLPFVPGSQHKSNTADTWEAQGTATQTINTRSRAPHVAHSTFRDCILEWCTGNLLWTWAWWFPVSIHIA